MSTLEGPVGDAWRHLQSCAFSAEKLGRSRQRRTATTRLTTLRHQALFGPLVSTRPAAIAVSAATRAKRVDSGAAARVAALKNRAAPPGRLGVSTWPAAVAVAAAAHSRAASSGAAASTAAALAVGAAASAAASVAAAAALAARAAAARSAISS